MASNLKKRSAGESLHAAEVRTKAALDKRDEKSIIRVRVHYMANERVVEPHFWGWACALAPLPYS